MFRLATLTRDRSASSGGVLLLTGASLVAALVAFCVNILMARTMGPAGRGEVAFLLQIAYFLAPIISLGMEFQLLRPAQVQRANPYWRLPAVAFILLVILGALRNPELLLAIPVAVITSHLAISRAISIATRDFKAYFALFGLFQATILVSSIILYLLQVTDWRYWIAGYVVPGVFVLLWDAVVSTVLSRSTRGAFASRTQLSFALASLARLAANRIERLMLPLIADPAQLGLYVAIATATEPVYWFSHALADFRARHSEPPTSLKGLARTIGSDVVLFSIPTTLAAALIYLFLDPLFGASFEPARPLVFPLALSGVLLATSRQLASWVLRGPRPRLLGPLEITIALAAFPIYAIGITLGGALGAAWASAVASGLALGLFCAALGYVLKQP